MFAGILACSNSVFGLGFQLPDQDAFATARGNAFVATADDPAAVYYNPAGISQIDGKELSIGAYGIVFGSSYKGYAGNIDSKLQLGVLPQVFSTAKLSDKVTFGFGTYSPFGLRYEWPMSAPFSALGQRGEIDYFRANAVLSFQILPTLSLALGPELDYSEADIKETLPGFNNQFKGRSFAPGYDAGVLWKPWTQHSFGVTYRSETVMRYDGAATSLLGPGTVPSSATVHLPQEVAFGYSYRPTEQWNFEADASWADWSGLKTVYVQPQAIPGTPNILPFNWNPSWMFDFGATRYLGEGWRVSGGYMFVENTSPNATFNPLVPDSDRHIFSLGVGKKYNKFSWDIAYQLAWGPSRTVANAAFPESIANGTYEFLSHAISINFGYRF